MLIQALLKAMDQLLGGGWASCLCCSIGEYCKGSRWSCPVVRRHFDRKRARLCFFLDRRSFPRGYGGSRCHPPCVQESDMDASERIHPRVRTNSSMDLSYPFAFSWASTRGNPPQRRRKGNVELAGTEIESIRFSREFWTPDPHLDASRARFVSLFPTGR